jgi:hypothetical protein
MGSSMVGNTGSVGAAGAGSVAGAAGVAPGGFGAAAGGLGAGAGAWAKTGALARVPRSAAETKAVFMGPIDSSAAWLCKAQERPVTAFGAAIFSGLAARVAGPGSDRGVGQPGRQPRASHEKLLGSGLLAGARESMGVRTRDGRFVRHDAAGEREVG